MALNLTPELHPNHNGTTIFVCVLRKGMQEGRDSFFKK